MGRDCPLLRVVVIVEISVVEAGNAVEEVFVGAGVAVLPERLAFEAD